MSRNELEERECDQCGKKAQERVTFDSDCCFLGWVEVRARGVLLGPPDRLMVFDFCGMRCAMDYFIEAESEQMERYAKMMEAKTDG
jgi:hypothetical protein